MHIRALKADDYELYQEAFDWTGKAPEWFRQLDSVFGWPDFETYYEQTKDKISFGIFDNELVALVTIIERARGIYEAELSARRGTDVLLIIEATRVIRDAVFAHGCLEGFMWVALRNRMVLKVCEAAGFQRDGIRMFRGVCKGRVIEWVRLSCRRMEWVNEQRAKDNDHADAVGHAIGDAVGDAGGHKSEYLRVHDSAGYSRHSGIA
jgi:hypothetical protein